MKTRVLVIEDNQTNVDLMVYLIEALGWSALVANDGEAGVAAAGRDRPDLIVCDIHLPRLDGFGVVARVKADPALRGIPVLAVTALAMVGDRERAYAAGFDGYVSKPLVPESFLDTLREYLPQAASRPLGIGADVPPTTVPVAAPAGALILVVNDRQEVLDLAGNLLTPLGYEVRCALDYSTALAVARAQKPALLITDMDMPRRDGLALIAALRAETGMARLPIVLVSSVGPAELDAALAKGGPQPDIILMQPLEAERLIEAVRNLLAAPGAAVP